MAKVLIIEDSPTQAALLSELVVQAGHDPIVCTDFQRGIAQVIKGIEPQLVLLDLTLLGPDGKQIADGFQICREIKRVSSRKIGVIIVSAKGDDDSAEWAVLQGADAFLQKPFAVDDLIQTINEVMQNQ